jgi:hypothetical protein
VWPLLAEFAAPGEPDDHQHLTERVTGIVQELGLQPAGVERIQKAVVEALRRVARRGNQDQHSLPLRVRIWISDPHTKDLLPSSSGVHQSDPQERRGWGFFLIERQIDDAQASAGQSHHVIELYLYQERERSREQPG